MYVVLTGIDVNFPDKPLNTLDCGDDIVIGGSPHLNTNVIEFAKEQNNLSDPDFVFPVIHCHSMYGDSDDVAASPANADYGKAITNGGVNTGKFLNNWNALTQAFGINAIRTEDNDTSVDNAFVLVPQFKLTYIVKKIFESLGYSCIGDFFTDVFIDKLLFLNYFGLDSKEKKYFVAAKSNNSQTLLGYGEIVFDDVISLGCEDIDGCYNNSAYEIKSVGYISIYCKFTLRTIITTGPMFIFRGAYLISSGTPVLLTYIQNEPCYTVDKVYEINASFRAYSGDIGKNIVITTGISVGGVQTNTNLITNASVTFTHTSYQNLNVYSNKIHIANHVTDNTVATILNALKVNFGLAMWFNAEKKEIEISFLKDVLNSYHFIDVSKMITKDTMEIIIIDPPGYWITQKSDSDVNDITNYVNIGSFVKLTDLPIPDTLNVIAEVLEEGCFYIYIKSDTDFTLSWTKYGTSTREIKIGIVDDLATTNVTVALDVVVTTNVIMQNRLLPDSNQLGTSAFFQTGVNDTDMQILIWHGMSTDQNNLLYPYASALKYDVSGNIISDVELRLDGESGVFPNYLKSWYDFMNTAETISLQMKLKSTDVISLLQLFKPQVNKASQQIRKIRYNGSLLLPKTFSFIVPLQGGFIEAQMDTYKDGGVIL